LTCSAASAYAALLERAQLLGRGGGAESLLSVNLRLALRQSITDLFQRFIAAHLDGAGERASEMPGREIAALGAAVAVIEEARDSGALRRRLPSRFRLGNCVLDFPSPAAYALSERLAAACAGAGP
jgi:hypothetical protein